MVSFEIFVKAMPPSLSDLKVLPSFCFAFKIPDDRAVTNKYNTGKFYCKNRFCAIIELFIYIFFVLFQEWICHVNLLPTKNPQVYFIILPRAKWIMEQCCVWPVM